MPPEITAHIGPILLLIVIGAVGGLLSGLLGVGGGIIFVPALYFCFTSFAIGAQYAIHIAIGTSLAIILATASSSAFWHNKKGSVDFAIIKSWWPYVVTGVAAGTFFASYTDSAMLKKLFSIATILMAIYMALSKEAAVEPARHRVSKAVQHLVALLIGTISSLIGVGGAMLNVPFMTYIGVPMRKAVGTGGALGLVISFPAVIGYILSGLPHIKELPPYSLGYINLLAVVVIMPICLLLSPVGVNISHSMPKNRLRQVFAVVLTLVSLRMLFST